MNIEIVDACLEHIDDIMVIENLSFKIPWSRQSITDEIIKNRSAMYFCARAAGKTIGYAGMWHIVDEGHITNIAVHPEFRNAGVGGTLLQGVIGAARNAGIRRLTLEVRESNMAARSLYEKYGFGHSGIRKAYYADNNEDAIIMWKVL